MRYLASLFIDVEMFEASVAAALAEPLADPVITITPLISGWSLHQFARTALEILRQPEMCRHVDTLRHLHIAFARGAHLWEALAGLHVSPSIVASLREAIGARRRMRKTRLRDAIKACTAAETCAMRLCLVSYLRSRRYTRFAMPPVITTRHDSVPITSHTFYCCTVCGTTRSSVGGQGVKGATRCLYDFETRGLSCGKRGALQEACSATPLMQVPLREGVFHVGNGQGAFARCPLCDCFFRYDLRAWTKGVFKCCACHYTIVRRLPAGRGVPRVRARVHVGSDADARGHCVGLAPSVRRGLRRPPHMQRGRQLSVGAVQFFVCASDSEVLLRSAHHVTSDALYCAAGLPHDSGLLSPRMGPHAGVAGQRCNVCGRTVDGGCSGHPGHISLDAPVPHPLFPELEVNHLLVPPPSLRPTRTANGRRQEHAWTVMLRHILRARGHDKVLATVQRYFFDAHEHTRGVSCGWAGKEGMFRQQLLGRRTGMCARAVITPCTALHPGEVGVPAAWAQNLSIPEHVAPFNRERLWNTPGVVPPKPRLGQLVERPLRDNDYVVLNRQPTLSQHSIMGMRVRLVDSPCIQINPVSARAAAAAAAALAPHRALTPDPSCSRPPSTPTSTVTRWRSSSARSLHGRAETATLARPERCSLSMIQDASTDYEQGPGRYGGCRSITAMHEEAQRRYAECDARGLTITLRDIADLRVPPKGSASLGARAQHAMEHTRDANALKRIVRGGKGKPFNLVQCHDFSSGLTPQEYLRSSIDVRASLVATYRKTPTSGYMSRKITTLLDGLNVAYDNTVRENNFWVVRFENDLGCEPGGNLGVDVAAQLSRDVTQANLNSFHNAGCGERGSARCGMDHIMRGHFPYPSHCEGAAPRRHTPAAPLGLAAAPTAVEATYHQVYAGAPPPAHRARFAAEHASALRAAFDHVFQAGEGAEAIVSTEEPYAPRWVGVEGSPASNARDFAEGVLPALPRTGVVDNLHYVYQSLGIEAARAVLLSRLSACSRAKRATCVLYADFVARTGVLRFATRKHIQQQTSPVAAAGFETTLRCLRKAAANNVTDHLRQASAYMTFNATLRQPFEVTEMHPTPPPAAAAPAASREVTERNNAYKPYNPANLTTWPTS